MSFIPSLFWNKCWRLALFINYTVFAVLCFIWVIMMTVFCAMNFNWMMRAIMRRNIGMMERMGSGYFYTFDGPANDDVSEYSNFRSNDYMASYRRSNKDKDNEDWLNNYMEQQVNGSFVLTDSYI